MKSVLAVIGAILLALFVGWINSKLKRKDRFANASLKFRTIFLQELKDIYPDPVNWPDSYGIDGLLRSKFPTLQAAVEDFRFFLPWYKKYFFDRAWFKYQCSTGRKIDIQCYHHYMPFKGESSVNGKTTEFDKSKIYKQTFKKNVEDILKYAKQK